MTHRCIVLGKNDPLENTWLAAHWNKKLTKVDVLETNIEKIVEDIFFRFQKKDLSIGASGHLIFGAVQIYARKIKYLLTDCNDFLDDLKKNLTGLKDIDLHDSAQFSVNQSRLEETIMGDNGFAGKIRKRKKAKENESVFDQIPDITLAPSEVPTDSSNIVLTINITSAPAGKIRKRQKAKENESVFDQRPDITLAPSEVPTDSSNIVPTINQPSVAPFSVAPPSAALQSVAPGLTFDDLEQLRQRIEAMQQIFEQGFTHSDVLSFKNMTSNLNKNEAASMFYALLFLENYNAVITEQEKPFGDIHIRKGPNFGGACYC